MRFRHGIGERAATAAAAAASDFSSSDRWVISACDVGCGGCCSRLAAYIPSSETSTAPACTSY